MLLTGFSFPARGNKGRLQGPVKHGLFIRNFSGGGGAVSPRPGTPPDPVPRGLRPGATPATPPGPEGG